MTDLRAIHAVLLRERATLVPTNVAFYVWTTGETSNKAIADATGHSTSRVSDATRQLRQWGIWPTEVASPGNAPLPDGASRVASPGKIASPGNNDLPHQATPIASPGNSVASPGNPRVRTRGGALPDCREVGGEEEEGACARAREAELRALAAWVDDCWSTDAEVGLVLCAAPTDEQRTLLRSLGFRGRYDHRATSANGGRKTPGVGAACQRRGPSRPRPRHRRAQRARAGRRGFAVRRHTVPSA